MKQKKTKTTHMHAQNELKYRKINELILKWKELFDKCVNFAGIKR